MDIRAYLLNAASQSCLSFLLLPRLSCELYRCSSGTDKLTSADTARKEKVTLPNVFGFTFDVLIASVLGLLPEQKHFL